MAKPWFGPGQSGMVGGGLGGALGAVGGGLGALVGTMAPRGKCKKPVYLILTIILVGLAGLTVAGIIALISGQPYHVYYSLGFPGLLGLCVIGSLSPVIVARYREAERRKMAAQDM